jgi:hypothetical protein
VSEHDLAAHPPQEPDVLAWGWLLGIFVGVTVVVVLLVAWAVALAHVGGGEHVPVPEPVPAGLDRSALDYWLLEEDQPRARERAGERKHLNGWGWVDRTRGRVHMPIEVAIDEAVAAQENRP